VAVDNSGVENNGDIWIYDLDRPTTTRLTFDMADESCPIWSADGERLVICSMAGGASAIHLLDLKGRVKQEVLLDTAASDQPTAWSPDGQWIVYERRNSVDATQKDIWILSLADGSTRPFADSPFEEVHGQISPDGRWLSYTSDESGRAEIYVQPFPDGGRKRQVSTDGGSAGHWRGDGEELFYISPDGSLMAVSVSAESGFRAETPTMLFRTRIRWASGDHYDVFADGQSFLINEHLDDESSEPMSLILNWSTGLDLDRP